MINNALQFLIAGREKISKPENWTQKCFARNSFNYAEEPNSTWATCWCALGAMKIFINYGDTNNTYDSYLSARNFLAIAINHFDSNYGAIVVEYNDSHTHAEVLAMYDKAIELASKNV